MKFKKIIKCSLATALIFSTATILSGCKKEESEKHNLIKVLNNNIEVEKESISTNNENKLIGYKYFSSYETPNTLGDTEIIEDYSRYGLLVLKNRLGYIGFYSLPYQKYLIEPQNQNELIDYEIHTDLNLGYFININSRSTGSTLYDSLGNSIQNSYYDVEFNYTREVNDEIYLSITINDIDSHYKYNSSNKLESVNSIPAYSVTPPANTDETFEYGDYYAPEDKIDLTEYGVKDRYLTNTNNVYTILNKNNIALKSFNIPYNAKDVFLIGNNLIYQTYTVDSLNEEIASTNLEKTYAIDLQTFKIKELDLPYIILNIETIKDEEELYTYGIAYVIKKVNKEFEISPTIALINENGKILEDLTKYTNPKSFIKINNNYYNEDTKIIYDSKLKEISHLENINPIHYEEAQLFVGKENGKYGAVDYNGKVVIPFVYDSLNPLDSTIDFNKNCIIGQKGNNYHKINTLTGDSINLGNNVTKLYDDLYLVIDQNSNNEKIEIIGQDKTHITFGTNFSQHIQINSITSANANKIIMNPLLGEYVVTKIETSIKLSHFVVTSTKELKNSSTFETIKVGTSGLYQDGIRTMSWYEITEKYPNAFSHDGKINANKSAPAVYEDSYLSELSGHLIIDESIVEIEDLAFLNCVNLTSITLPRTITTIGFNAFQYNTNLTSIRIPSSVTTLRPNAFYGCANLSEVIIDADLSTTMIENSDILLSATNVYISEHIDVEGLKYLEENFTEQTNSNISGHKMYIRNTQ